MWWVWVSFQDKEGGGIDGTDDTRHSCHEFHCYVLYKNA